MFYNIKVIFGIMSVLYSKTNSEKLSCNSVTEELNSIFNTDKHNLFINIEGIPIEKLITFYGISTGQTEFTIIDKSNMGQVFNLNYNIGVLIHAFTESFNGSLSDPNDIWMQDVARAWTSQDNINIICVDWFPLGYNDVFVAATNHTKLVGNYVASFIQDISDEHGIPLNTFTVVGHSLGGQIAGIVGGYLNGAIGSIIALDPAGPCFTYPVDEGIENRLDKSDAIFVQVLHTACGSLGTQINCGHVDFYVNGGAVQPGCISSILPLIDPSTISCNHLRSTHIFISSIDRNNVFRGNQCLLAPAKCNAILGIGSIIPIIDTISQPILQCYGTSEIFGIYSTKIPGAYLFETSANYPYVL